MIQGTRGTDRPVAQHSRTRRALRWALPVVIVLGVSLPVLPSLRRWLAAERSVEFERLRTGRVVRGDLERDVSVQGRVVAASHPTAFSPAAGVVSFSVRSGEVVEKGQVLAHVASPEIENRLEQEGSTLEALKIELERERIRVKQALLANEQQKDLAQLELEAAGRGMARAERSRADGILNLIEYEKAQDELKRAGLELAHARQDADLERETLEFELRTRELQLERQRLVVAEARRKVEELTIRALVAGRVAGLDVEQRDAVVVGQPLVTVVDLSEFEVEVAIPEAYADEAAPGTPAVVAHDGREFMAELKSVSPQVEGSQVQGVVRFVGAEMPAGLRQSQRLPTRLILDSRLDVLKVPRGPFLEAGGGRLAFVVDHDLAVARKIRVGAASVGEVQVLEGLEEGEEIIISDTARFENAERVFLRR